MEEGHDDHNRAPTVPSFRMNRDTSTSFESGESHWDGVSGVTTNIVAGDGSCGGSFIMEPMSIKVKTSHKREESPAKSHVKVPLKVLAIKTDRTAAWQ